MTMPAFVARRLGVLVFQVVVIVTVAFLIVRVLPGDPAYRAAGPITTPQRLHEIRQQLGLDASLPQQFASFVGNAAKGDLGVSLSTGQTVMQDLRQRVPATMELVLVGMLVAVAIALPLGVRLGYRRTGAANRFFRGYSLLAGAQPEYWWGLMLVFVFFTTLGWAPGPSGRLDLAVPAPPRVTGFYLVDSAISGDWQAFSSACSHLVLPVATIAIVYMAPILKMTRDAVETSLRSESVRFLRASGIPEGRTARAALRMAAPPVVTTIGITTAYLLSGVALVETVFGWNGLGQYAVQAAIRADYPAIQGVVLTVAVFAALTYLAIDVVQRILDPRAGAR